MSQEQSAVRLDAADSPIGTSRDQIEVHDADEDDRDATQASEASHHHLESQTTEHTLTSIFNQGVYVAELPVQSSSEQTKALHLATGYDEASSVTRTAHDSSNLGDTTVIDAGSVDAAGFAKGERPICTSSRNVNFSGS